VNRNDRWLNANYDNPGNRWNRDNGFAFVVSQLSLFPRTLRGFSLKAVFATCQAFCRLLLNVQKVQYIFYYPMISFPKTNTKRISTNQVLNLLFADKE